MNLLVASIVAVIAVFGAWSLYVFPKLRYGLPVMYGSFVVANFIHEVGHAIGNGLTGGSWGLAGNAGFIGNIGFGGWFLIEPVFWIQLQNVGEYGVMLLAGPWIVILLFVVLARAWQGTESLLLTWITVGVMVRAVFDAIYLFPIDVFPDDRFGLDGDGMALYHHWQNAGLDWTTGNVYLNFEYLVGVAALLVVLYHVRFVLATNEVFNR